MTRVQLTDANWEFIGPYLPIGGYSPYPERLRQQFEGVIWRFRTRRQWREPPQEFGAWPTLHNRFRQWRDAGTFQALLEGLTTEPAKQGEVSLSLTSTDSTTARTHHDAAGIHPGEDVITALEKAAAEEEKLRPWPTASARSPTRLCSPSSPPPPSTPRPCPPGPFGGQSALQHGPTLLPRLDPESAVHDLVTAAAVHARRRGGDGMLQLLATAVTEGGMLALANRGSQYDKQVDGSLAIRPEPVLTEAPLQDLAASPASRRTTANRLLLDLTHQFAIEDLLDP